MRWPERAGQRRATTRAVRRVTRLEQRITNVDGTSIAWCHLNDAEGHTVDHSGAINTLDLTVGSPGASFYTNASDVFAAADLDPAGGPGSFGGLKILTPGVYRASLYAAWDTIEDSATGQVYRGPVSDGIGGSLGFSFLLGRYAVKGDDDWNHPLSPHANEPVVFWQELWNVPGDDLSIDGSTGNNATPVELLFWALQNGATADGHIDRIGILIERLGPEFYSSIFGVTGTE